MMLCLCGEVGYAVTLSAVCVVCCTVVWYV